MRTHNIRGYFWHKRFRCDEEKDFTEWSVEKQLTLIITAAMPFLLAGAVWFCRSVPAETMGEITCPLRLAHGMYCPACGGTRAFLFLLHGDLLQSLYYHPLIVTAAAELFVFYGSNLLHYGSLYLCRRGKCRSCIWGARFYMWYLWIPALVTALNFIIKNYYWLVKGIALIP